MPLRTRVVLLGDDGAGIVGTPPARYAGCTPDTVTASNLGRSLTAGMLLPTEYEVVSGEIEFTGAPDTVVRCFLEQG